MKKEWVIFVFSVLLFGFLFYISSISTIAMVTIRVIQYLALFFSFYAIIIGFIGLRKLKPIVIEKPKNKFALLVAAHNEEAVVGEIVKNLDNINYPKDMYDVFVICDNCTDHTARVVRENGGTAMERFNPKERGKGFALEWMFKKLWDLEKEGKHYDAVVMFDADNLVTRNFLSVMNTKLINGFEVVQGYLDTKNPDDSWITKSYAFAYWSVNRMYQLSRENLGLSAQIGGTGVVVTTKVLKEIGWGATSLTEDLEFTQRYILQTGKAVGWAHEAKVYDEKPLDMTSSWKQRVRWMQGHADCMMRYSGKLFGTFLKTGKLIYFDSLVYLIQPSKIIVSLLLLVFTLLSLGVSIFQVDTDYSNLLVDFWIFLVVTLLYYSQPFVGLIMERKSKSILWFPFVYLYSLTWLPISLIGFIKRNEKTWSHTKHDRVVDTTKLEL